MDTTSSEYETRINWLHIAPLVLYFLFSPIYLFPSGYPQIADLIIGFGIMFLAVESLAKPGTKIRLVFFLGLGFAVYTVFINLINYMFFPHARFLMSCLYYPFNVLIFIYAVKILERYGKNLYRALFYIITAAIVGEFIWSIATTQSHWRETGSFNNPNQLAYWALLSATMIVVLRQDTKFGLWELSAIAILGVLEALALSKTGLISYSLFLVILLSTPLITKTTRILSIGLALITVLLSMMFFQNSTFSKFVLERPFERLQNIGQEPDDSAEARGYYRPIEFPEYAILGAGEGKYERFEPDNPVELHSGIMTIIFSYGMVGFALFSIFLLIIFYKKSLYILLFFIPVLLFSVSEQSFRFSHFWIFLALTYTCSPQKERDRGIFIPPKQP